MTQTGRIIREIQNDLSSNLPPNFPFFNEVFQIRAFHNDNLWAKNGIINSYDFNDIQYFPTARDIDIHFGKSQV